jgi:glycosyltransferase involved in cell wall biosynthesis
MKLPKVLILGPTFNKNTGGGITLSNLFSGWDKDKIAVASTGHEFYYKSLDTSICDTFYVLGIQEYKWSFPLNYLQHKFESGQLKIKPATVDFVQNPAFSKPVGLRKKFIDSYFFPFLRYFGFFHFISKYELSASFCKWLDKFKPDILYVQVSERAGVNFARQVTAYLKVPMILHMMDDWPSTISNHGLFKKYWNRKIDSDFKLLIKDAALLMSISDDMAVEYEKRYGRKFVTFHNPIDCTFWKQYPKTNYELGKPPTLLYAGRIGIGVEDSLETIAIAIEQLNREMNISIQFDLQTKEIPPWINRYKCVVHKKFVPYHDLPKVFAKADFLVLPYDFSNKGRRFIKYSMPTKMPEYMMSGTPIIIFAPAETAVVNYAQQYGCAKMITENNVEAFKKGFQELLENKLERTTMAKNAVVIAEKRHNANNVRLEFKQAVASLIAEPVRFIK